MSFFKCVLICTTAVIIGIALYCFGDRIKRWLERYVPAWVQLVVLIVLFGILGGFLMWLETNWRWR